MTVPSHLSRQALTALVVGICLVACANNPPADEKMAVAKAAVARAEQSGAPQDAPADMAAARDKLASAQQASDKHNMAMANELAEQANIDAQVAEASALQQRAHKAAAEFDSSMKTLQQESQRNSQSQ